MNDLVILPSDNLITHNFKFRVEDVPYIQNLYFINYPTFNCQVFSISPFRDLLEAFNNNDDVLDIIRKAKKHAGSIQPLMLFDLKEQYKLRIETFNLVFITDYISSNGSKMLMGLIKIY